ncbi:hypothetical protein DAI22_11g208100 [Oryza sativa Japonica Group]|nr:hypothetical protein DAI22_11g208100 [Oryza sativa Japonica Group]
MHVKSPSILLVYRTGQLNGTTSEVWIGHKFHLIHSCPQVNSSETTKSSPSSYSLISSPPLQLFLSERLQPSSLLLRSFQFSK